MYAIIQSRGRQVKVTPGATVTVDGTLGEPGKEVTLHQVLLIAKDGGEMLAGAPFVASARVVGVVDGLARTEDSRVQEEAPQGHAPHEGTPRAAHAGPDQGHRRSSALREGMNTVMAHKKGQGSSRNGRDSNSQRLGVKRHDGNLVTGGSISCASAGDGSVPA